MKCPNCGKSLWFVRTFCPFCKASINAPSRPQSVKVVCWVFITLNCLALFYVLISGKTEPRLPDRSLHPVLYAFCFAGPACNILSGACALFGHNWARWLLVTCLVGNAVGGVILHAGPTFLFGRLLLLGIAGYYLFRPQAKAFFVGKWTTAPNAT
jgi:hypothetical protein